jgi:hypothetical protein
LPGSADAVTVVVPPTVSRYPRIIRMFPAVSVTDKFQIPFLFHVAVAPVAAPDSSTKACPVEFVSPLALFQFGFATTPATSLLRLQHHFPTVKCLGVSARCVTLHSAQAHQGTKGFLSKPSLGLLRLERVHDVANLLFEELGLERHEDIRLAQITVIFRDFIFEDQVVTKGVPSQFRDQAVILMRVFTVVSENEVRRNRLQLLKGRFKLGPHKRHKSILERLEHWPFDSGRSGE